MEVENTSLLQRKTLHHGRPFLSDSVYFLTVNAAVRGQNLLATPEVAPLLWQEWNEYERLGKCWALLFLVMPDHVHGLFKFASDVKLESVVRGWKKLTCMRYGINWQRDFFGHRLRSQESFRNE